jgi:hypothetical protein
VLPQDVQLVQSETQRSNGDPKIKINLRPQVKEAKRVGGQVARAAEKGTRITRKISGFNGRVG